MPITTPKIVALLPGVFVLAHSAAVLMLAVVVGSLKGESVMLWNLFMVLDFPASIIGASFFSPVENWVRSRFGAHALFSAGYGIYFAVLGGLQWYVVARSVVFAATKFAERSNRK